MGGSHAWTSSTVAPRDDPGLEEPQRTVGRPVLERERRGEHEGEEVGRVEPREPGRVEGPPLGAPHRRRVGPGEDEPGEDVEEADPGVAAPLERGGPRGRARQERRAVVEEQDPEGRPEADAGERRQAVGARRRHGGKMRPPHRSGMGPGGRGRGTGAGREREARRRRAGGARTVTGAATRRPGHRTSTGRSGEVPNHPHPTVESSSSFSLHMSLKAQAQSRRVARHASSQIGGAHRRSANSCRSARSRGRLLRIPTTCAGWLYCASTGHESSVSPG